VEAKVRLLSAVVLVMLVLFVSETLAWWRQLLLKWPQ